MHKFGKLTRRNTASSCLFLSLIRFGNFCRLATSMYSSGKTLNSVRFANKIQNIIVKILMI